MTDSENLDGVLENACQRLGNDWDEFWPQVDKAMMENETSEIISRMKKGLAGEEMERATAGLMMYNSNWKSIKLEATGLTRGTLSGRHADSLPPAKDTISTAEALKLHTLGVSDADVKNEKLKLLFLFDQQFRKLQLLLNFGQLYLKNDHRPSFAFKATKYLVAIERFDDWRAFKSDKMPVHDHRLSMAAKLGIDLDKSDAFAVGKFWRVNGHIQTYGKLEVLFEQLIGPQAKAASLVASLFNSDLEEPSGLGEHAQDYWKGRGLPGMRHA